MTCPLCQKRKAARFCPARGDSICPVCCATEREVTIDCPSDCPYLVASRSHEQERREIDWSKIPFPDVKIPPSALRNHAGLLSMFAYVLSEFAHANRPLVDADAIAALQSLAEGYRTLSSGIYYERPPDYHLQRELYDHLKSGIEEYKKEEARRLGVGNLRDETIRDGLIFFAQLGATRTNGRPKGRAFLDFLRTKFELEEFEKPASNIVLP